MTVHGLTASQPECVTSEEMFAIKKSPYYPYNVVWKTTLGAIGAGQFLSHHKLPSLPMLEDRLVE